MENLAETLMLDENKNTRVKIHYRFLIIPRKNQQQPNNEMIGNNTHTVMAQEGKPGAGFNSGIDSPTVLFRSTHIDMFTVGGNGGFGARFGLPGIPFAFS